MFRLLDHEPLLIHTECTLHSLLLCWSDFTITLLMITGSIADNIIIARKMRDKYVPWSSILFAFAASLVTSLFFTPLIGLVAAPVGLFLAENRRLKNNEAAIDSTKAYMIGWGWAFGVRFLIGLVMIGFWMIWAWVL